MSEQVSNGFFLSASYLLINTNLLFTNWCQRVPKSRASSVIKSRRSNTRWSNN